jgi:hypothetical protein
MFEEFLNGPDSPLNINKEIDKITKEARAQ